MAWEFSFIFLSKEIERIIEYKIKTLKMNWDEVKVRKLGKSLPPQYKSLDEPLSIKNKKFIVDNRVQLCTTKA